MGDALASSSIRIMLLGPETSLAAKCRAVRPWYTPDRQHAGQRHCRHGEHMASLYVPKIRAASVSGIHGRAIPQELLNTVVVTLEDDVL